MFNPTTPDATAYEAHDAAAADTAADNDALLLWYP